MLDINYVRNNLEAIKDNCKNRNVKCQVEKVLELDKERLNLIKEVEELRSQKNAPKGMPTKNELASLKQIKEKEDKLSAKLTEVEKDYKEALFHLPNVTHPDTPIGKDENENVEIRRFGKPKKFDFEPKDHVELGESLDLIDFEAGSKVAGTKFYFLKNEAVLLEQALLLYGISIAKKHGFKLIITPDLAKTEIVNSMGYQPRGPEAQIYNVESSDLSLIGTAEITLGGLHLNQLLKEEELPILYAGISHAFRTEAGAYGKHSRGLYRVHQFTKLELFVYCKPEDSEEWHQKLVNIEEEIFQGLDIPIRTMEICTGDLGAVAYRKYDIEGWMPGRNEFGEITSASNCTDYQARNLNIKYRTSSGKTEFVHMLNGTGIAISRALIVILENFQQADGSVKIPKVLQQYTGIESISRK